MVEVHAAFHVVRNKRYVTVVDEDNGVSVVSDLDYVLRSLADASLIHHRVPVLLRDAFGCWDIIDIDGTLRGLDAKTEEEALLAA